MRPIAARNWRWPTLSAVMAGRLPEHKLNILQEGENPIDLLIFNAGENHSIRALNEDLIFVAFLREAPDAKSTAYHSVGEKYVA